MTPVLSAASAAPDPSLSGSGSLEIGGRAERMNIACSEATGEDGSLPSDIAAPPLVKPEAVPSLNPCGFSACDEPLAPPCGSGRCGGSWCDAGSPH